MKKITNICYGCSACSNICPTKAIKMSENKKGFLIPQIDEKLCINCGACVNVCNIKNVFNEVKNVYIGKIENEKLREESQSGGAFVAISDVILSKGGVVYGAVLDDELEAVHIRAESAEERNRQRKSKYIQSRIEDMYLKVEKDLEERKVLFTGTPCQVGGLLKYCNAKKIDTKNLFTMDFICHGTPSVLIWREIIKYYEKKYKTVVNQVIFRDKAYGWGSHWTTIIHEKGVVKSSVHRKFFYSNLELRDSCYECEYTTGGASVGFYNWRCMGCKRKKS